VDPIDLADIEACAEATITRYSPRPFCPHEPTEKQREFLALDCLEALYGGAAGGGKSDALLMAALQYVDVPGYAALILRRTYPELALEGAIMDRAQKWLAGTRAHWNADLKKFTFPSGATLTFAHCQSPRDVDRFSSAEFQFIGIDEITTWPERPAVFLLSRLRRNIDNDVPIRFRCASNPIGIGHAWVKHRYVDEATRKGVYVPARLDDNPHLDRAKYIESLERLDEDTRRRLRDGDWTIVPGGLVYSYDDVRNGTDVLPELEFYLLGQDYGFTDSCSFSVLGWRKNDPVAYVVESYKRRKMTPSLAAEETQRLNAKYKFVRMVGDIGGLGKGYVEEARARFSLPIEAADKHNKRGYQSLLNGDLERGRIKVYRPACKSLIREWSELPWNEDQSTECEGFENHCADGVLYGWRATTAYHERPAAPPPSAQERAAEEERALIEAEERALREREESGWY